MKITLRQFANCGFLLFMAMTATPLVASSATNTYTITASSTTTLADNETAIVSQGNPATAITGASITVGDGATLILNGVNFSTSSAPAITCQGNATIVLADGTANTVASTGADFAGIKAGPGNTTLAIVGPGSLHASGGAYGAGIGGGRIDKNTGETVGNIRILGGTVSGVCSASGGQPSAAGIGSGFKGACGDILIVGGVVTGICTTASNSYGAGIGSGIEGNCGGVTITAGAREVVATRGAKSVNNAIGAGYNAGCGPLSFDGSLTLATTKSYLDHDTWIITPYSSTGATPAAPAVFPDEGDAIITKFEQKTNGTWRVFAFAELEKGTAEGVGDGMVSIYSADTIDGLSDPSAKLRLAPTSVKNAVKAEFEVESGAQTQFFRVKFENAD